MMRFGEDLGFCSKHTEVVLLRDGPRQVALAASYQARVLTSTLAGPGGFSHGWINQNYIAQGTLHPKFNPYGGEDRLWLSPEAGQFGFHFDPGVPFELPNARVLTAVDREPFDLLERGDREALFGKTAELVNWSGTRFQLRIRRKIALINLERIWKTLDVSDDGLQAVAFESENELENAGREPWRKETGLLGAWVLGMYPASPRSTVVIPTHPGPPGSGASRAASYFGEIQGDRLHSLPAGAFFKADGLFRSKIGVHPRYAGEWLGCWDAQESVLTLVRYSRPPGAALYADGQWKIQERPYDGDVVSSYNDGPPEPGANSYGPYFELETMSPVRELVPGDSLRHLHQTFHLMGDRSALDRASRKTLGVGLADIEAALPVA